MSLSPALCFSPQVCELDIIFNFEKAYFILDEFLMGGEIQETSKQTVNRCIEASDMLQEVIRTRTLAHVQQHNKTQLAVKTINHKRCSE